MRGLEWVFVVLFVLGCIVAAPFIRRREEAKSEQAAIDLFRDRQLMVVRLLSGRESWLNNAKLFDPEIRHVQIIADSISIVKATENESTRRSRMTVIDTMVRELDALHWRGFTQASRQCVIDAVEDVRQRAILLSALAVVDKHLRASARATRAPTKQKYLDLAGIELAAARLRLSRPTELESIDLIIDSLRGDAPNH